MLVSLAIRDVVLIDRLEVGFGPGLNALTGETGAGKSILLDALGLAIGARAESQLVRRGPDNGPGQASVIAEFALEDVHPVRSLMLEQGLIPPVKDEPLVLRRLLAGDGRSRAFINDQAVSIGLLRAIGELLVEIEGQFASHGLMNAATHRAALDAFAGLGARVAATEAAARALGLATRAHDEAQAAADAARAEEEYLRHVVAELAELMPEPGEESALAAKRTMLMHGEKLGEALNLAVTALSDGKSVAARIGEARRILARSGDKAAGTFDPTIAALDRTADVLAEATDALERAGRSLQSDPAELATTEERLFALRALARKHRLDVDSLSALHAALAAKLAAIDGSAATLATLAAMRDAARTAFFGEAEELSAARHAVAAELDTAVMGELPALKLEKAIFRTTVERLAESQWGAHGIDRVVFEVATNPGTPPGPLSRVASGGELARFMLALKVVLAATAAVPTLVFDEADTGIGGATAAAVGERLARLGRKVQVLVVTHSPQVAAHAAHHLRVYKRARAGASRTAVETLDDPARREEIARMLAGAKITDEARAAAASLIARRRA